VVTHIAIVHLAFEPMPAARDLLTRYAPLRDYCTQLAACPDLRVSVLGRFSHDERFVEGQVDWRFNVDDPTRPIAAPWTWPRALYRQIDELRPDVVHVNGLIFPAQIRSLRRRLPATSALVAQHHGEPLTHRYVRWTPRTTLHDVDAFMFTADGIADEWRTAGRIARHQPTFEIVEASSTFTPLPRAESRRAVGLYGDPAVLWVGRLHARKAPLLALDVFDRARDRLNDPQLFMVYGSDDLLPEIQACCAERPALAKRVHLVGPVPHHTLAAWFSAADLFLTTSPAEGSNFALIESLACGLLPVCSDIPAHRAITANGDAGVLFPSGDPVRGADALVGAATRAAHHNGFNQGFDRGLDGRRQLRAHFDRVLGWPAIAREARRAYHAVAASRRSGDAHPGGPPVVPRGAIPR
jgi:glycosyltransferase involved in cell wall biosynthesis